MDLPIRKPYIEETATHYWREVVRPFLDSGKYGFSSNTKNESGYCGSYTCYHWFKEPSDRVKAFIVETDLKEPNP